MNTVSVIHCKNYEYEKVKAALIQTVENLGGFERYINKGEKVLLKINLLMKKTPEEATTTHPVFVQALAQMLKDYGADVIIGDSPGGLYNEKILKAIYKVTGTERSAEESGTKLNYDTKSFEAENPKGLYLKRLTVVNMIKNVDKVISVSKLKTHGMAKMTGAVKNMFGIIPGTLKAEYHLNMPEVKDFANALIDICVYANPVLSFMDGIVGMEGDGPSSGTPREIGAVIGSNNPFDLDLVAAKIINIKPEAVPTIDESIKRGLCHKDLNEIDLKGDNIEEFIITDFKAPKIRNINPVKNNVPKFAENFINMNLQPRPVFIHNKCIGCGDCFRNCPPHTIEMKNHKPIVHLDKCIRCFCCQELCPEKAVEIYRPLLFRTIFKQ